MPLPPRRRRVVGTGRWIYSASGVVVLERGYAALSEATNMYERLIVDVMDGVLDPSQPVFREDLED